MAFQFKIQLKDIAKPPVWRKVSVPADFSFFQFHGVIQVVFGWNNTHLFEFKDKEYQSNLRIGIPYEDDFFDPGFAAQLKDAEEMELSAVFKKAGEKLFYVYDFGDSWLHSITLEAIGFKNEKEAVCLSGKGACPPEDCGGVWAYEEMKDIFATVPGSEAAVEYRDWLGLDEEETWDAHLFNLDAVNTNLKLL
ncbi:plasmid pRiA4b ORF-3 family protein [Dysgonomonas sp. 521]|uniref:plasmid pRiA4b ORF-3 family protein n=1 Tax=Dysgonomonas sp. 521 TaxID=2302932 RepID=UPI0013D60F5A|nr:plasmid pRiA4b ORF-3 family protein [Dysgonomonas sp. 521]NDV93417.1 plasmid pRiA4b ORF-3 family protein [Dysgonomonas sp. 521]